MGEAPAREWGNEMTLTWKQLLIGVGLIIGLFGGGVATNALTHDCSTKHEVDVTHDGEITCDLDGSKLDVQVTCDCSGKFEVQGPPAPASDTPCETIEIVPVWSIGAGGGANAYMASFDYNITPRWSIYAVGLHGRYDTRVDPYSKWYNSSPILVSGDETYALVGAKWTKYKTKGGQTD